MELTEVAGPQVTLFLGSDVAELVVPLEIRHGPKGSPVGVHTRIGWTVTGRVPGYIQGLESVCKVHVATPEEELKETVKTWWRTENFGCRYDNDTQRSVARQSKTLVLLVIAKLLRCDFTPLLFN